VARGARPKEGGLAPVVTWWVSTPKWAAHVEVDDQGQVAKTPPVASWAKGKSWESFLRILQIRYPGEVKTQRLD